MKFRRVKSVLMRMKLRKNNFYEEVIFANKSVCKKAKKNVTQWMLSLQECKKIEVKKFKDLFKQDKDVSFPIKIKEVYGDGINIRFADSKGNKFYISKTNLNMYDEISMYSIVKKGNLLKQFKDVECYYKIYQDKSVVLLGVDFIQLNEDGTNGDICCRIWYNYDNDSEEITLYLHELNCKMKIEYPKKDNEINKETLNYLLESNKKCWYYYDVMPILKWFMTKTKKKEISIAIKTEINGEVFSEIEIVNDIVKKYTVTRVINEGELHIIKKIFAKKLDVFLSENDYLI